MLYVVPDIWGTPLKRGLRFVQWRRTRNSVKKRDPFVHGQLELPNTSPQAIELDPSGSRQPHFNWPGTGPGYENAEPGCMYSHNTPHSSINHPLRSADIWSGKVV